MWPGPTAVSAYFLKRMKTTWGSCNPPRRNIRLNTELVKKPKDLLEYVSGCSGRNRSHGVWRPQ